MPIPAFTTDEILTGEPTRTARLKWVIVVDGSTPPGRMVNAVACIAAAVGRSIDGLIGPGGSDAEGIEHSGLPWAGCTVLSATTEQLEHLRRTAAANETMFVADMPASAQTNRVYDEYLAELATTTAPGTIALGVVGPRNAVDRLVKRLPLLG